MAVFGRGLPREEDDAVRGRGRRAQSGAWRSRRIRFRHLNAPFVKVDSRRRTARKLGAMKSDGNSSDAYNNVKHAWRIRNGVHKIILYEGTLLPMS